MRANRPVLKVMPGVDSSFTNRVKELSRRMRSVNLNVMETGVCQSLVGPAIWWPTATISGVTLSNRSASFVEMFVVSASRFASGMFAVFPTVLNEFLWELGPIPPPTTHYPSTNWCNRNEIAIIMNINEDANCKSYLLAAACIIGHILLILEIWYSRRAS